MGLITNLIEKHVEDKHRDEENRKEALRQFYYSRINDTSTPPEVREQLSQDYFKLLSPEAKKSAQKGLGLIGKLKSAFGGGQQQPSPNGTLNAPQGQQQQPTQQSQPQQPQGGTKLTPPQFAQGAADKAPGIPTVTNPQVAASQAQPVNKLTGPAPVQAAPQSQPLTGPPAKPVAQVQNRAPQLPQHMFASTQDQISNKLALEDAEQKAWLKRGEDIGLKGRDLAEYAGSKGARLPAQGKRTTDKGIVRPGDDPSTGKPYEGSWVHIVEPDGSETWQKEAQKRTSSGVPRVIGHLSATDAKTQEGKGQKFQDEAGNDIDVASLPEQMGLVTVTQGDKTFYVPYTQNQTHFNVGGKVYAVPTLEQINMGGGAGVELGASRTPTASSHQQIAVDAQGNPVTNTLRSTSTPSTPGIAGRQQAAPVSGVAPSAPPRSNAPAAAPASSGDIKGIPLGMYNQSLQRVTPVREAATQIFGDPQQPDVRGLISFADLADNPQSRERLGKALRLTFTSLDQATGGANISAGAGPISMSTGGFGTLLQNAFGVPQKVADQQAKIMNDAIKDLTPQEREAYDATMSAFGTIVGLRSLTKASAAQASVSTIEREMPVIGVNTTNASQFYDQAQRLAEIVYNGTKGIPAGMWDKQMLERIKNLPSEVQKLKKSKPSPNGKLSGPSSNSTVDDLVKEYAGAK